VRLGTCIALELVAAAGVAGGACLGVIHVSRFADAYLSAPTAEAAPMAPREERPLVTPLPRSELRVIIRDTAVPSVFGAPDAELLAPLGAAKVVRVKWNIGGGSVSLRLDFANGARAAFKPEQTFLQSDPRREIAAYRLDRLIGLGRVPPAKPAAIALADVLAVVDPQYHTYIVERLAKEAVARDGVLHGELSWWIPEIRQAKIGGVGVDEAEGRARWIAYLQIGAAIPPAVRTLVEQLAACVLFDVLTDNPDRWSGNNAVTSPDGKVLYVMDNTMTFSLARFGHELNVGVLHRIQVFPRGLVGRIRALTEEQLAAALEGDGETKLGPLLTPQELHAVFLRRDNMLKHIDGLIAAHGEATVLALP
jgi:hypothetical protein